LIFTGNNPIMFCGFQEKHGARVWDNKHWSNDTLS
jgi:hypothetical protein